MVIVAPRIHLKVDNVVTATLFGHLKVDDTVTVTLLFQIATPFLQGAASAETT